MATCPYLSVVLPTRNRPDQLANAVTTILASAFTDFELIVVDQSGDDLTAARMLRLIANHAPVRLVRDSGLGSSHARNLGVAASLGGVVVFTDDDCEVSPEWLGGIATAFAADAGVGVACGAVIPAPHDTDAGFIVGYRPRRRERLTGRTAKLFDGGIGANMAFRRQALDAVGGWDELLGAGSLFDGAGDRDLVYRVLGAGYALMHLPEAQVIHSGFRNWQTGGILMRGRFRGIGAAYAKHVRLGDAIAAMLLLQELALAVANIVRSVVLARRPLGIGRLWGLLSGFFASFAQTIDSSTKRYNVGGPAPARMQRTSAVSVEAIPGRRAG